MIKKAVYSDVSQIALVGADKGEAFTREVYVCTVEELRKFAENIYCKINGEEFRKSLNSLYAAEDFVDQWLASKGLNEKAE
jgi:hypothetical protein